MSEAAAFPHFVPQATRKTAAFDPGIEGRLLAPEISNLMA
jgi:hypothetical protein